MSKQTTSPVAWLPGIVKIDASRVKGGPFIVFELESDGTVMFLAGTSMKTPRESKTMSDPAKERYSNKGTSNLWRYSRIIRGFGLPLHKYGKMVSHRRNTWYNLRITQRIRIRASCFVSLIEGDIKKWPRVKAIGLRLELPGLWRRCRGRLEHGIHKNWSSSRSFQPREARRVEWTTWYARTSINTQLARRACRPTESLLFSVIPRCLFLPAMVYRRYRLRIMK